MDYSKILYSIRFTIILLSCILAFIIRLFPNIVAEPIIHEFDPHFNWRCTEYAEKYGLYEFLNWYDNISWYPQGRPVGETSYPGMMFTSAIIKWTLQRLHIIIDIKDICIYMGPIFSVLTTIVAFLFGQLFDEKDSDDQDAPNSQARKNTKVGISSLGCMFASLISFLPGLISRSVSGSYDYECISLFILISCIYTFCYALNKGSIIASLISALFYGYMSLTWGGYVFISNCIPLFTMGLILLGQYSWRLYFTYSVWSIVGSLLSASVPFISDKIVKKPEHFSILGVLIVIQLWGFLSFIRNTASQASFNTVIVSCIMILPLFTLVLITVGISTGLLGGFSGRLMQMFDPSYASKNIPIIASVAEHQTTSWSMYYLDAGLLIALFPIGCFFILKDGLNRKTEGEYLILIYGLSTLYFASIMVRLVIVFCPSLALVTGIGIQRLLRISFKSIAMESMKPKMKKKQQTRMKENKNQQQTNDSSSNIEMAKLHRNDSEIGRRNKVKQLEESAEEISMSKMIEVATDSPISTQSESQQTNDSNSNIEMAKLHRNDSETGRRNKVKQLEESAEEISMSKMIEVATDSPISTQSESQPTEPENQSESCYFVNSSFDGQISGQKVECVKTAGIEEFEDEDEDEIDDHKSGLAKILIFCLFCVIISSVLHSVYFAAVSYSGDHIHFNVNTPYGPEPSDDYREGYRWLFTNTGRDERVMSWWDYGYQITSMGGRGCMADGNTNNFTHIGIIGMAMSSPEAISWRLARLMGADFMLVIFGGSCGYDGDDINKFMWMPRIANQTFTNISGPMYQLRPYYPIIGPWQTTNMTQSMMFNFCYKDFARFEFHPMMHKGFDLQRQVEVPHLKNIKLKLFEEAFTTKHWIVRIYRVKPDPLWDRVY